MWNLYRSSDHDQTCDLLQGDAERQVFFCAAADVQQVRMEAHSCEYTKPRDPPLGERLSLLLVLRPRNLWSGCKDAHLYGPVRPYTS